MPHHTSTQPNNPIIPSNPRPRPCLVRAVADLCARGDLASAVEALPLLSRRGLRLDSPPSPPSSSSASAPAPSPTPAFSTSTSSSPASAGTPRRPSSPTTS
ncbi:hypothetical protein QJS10_CPB15g00467 [Acorus calamus]|uniref:Uncharacterized protein n=1 Tax=Acorus calamus TaxID=4465 RepID=A0AAV9D532_ACOCL|nr:hypothetical protein QJS10_CPB15g00467 [Acorus calamus]